MGASLAAVLEKSVRGGMQWCSCVSVADIKEIISMCSGESDSTIQLILDYACKCGCGATNPSNKPGGGGTTVIPSDCSAKLIDFMCNQVGATKLGEASAALTALSLLPVVSSVPEIAGLIKVLSLVVGGAELMCSNQAVSATFLPAICYVYGNIAAIQKKLTNFSALLGAFTSVFTTPALGPLLAACCTTPVTAANLPDWMSAVPGELA